MFSLGSSPSLGIWQSSNRYRVSQICQPTNTWRSQHLKLIFCRIFVTVNLPEVFYTTLALFKLTCGVYLHLLRLSFLEKLSSIRFKRRVKSTFESRSTILRNNSIVFLSAVDQFVETAFIVVCDRFGEFYCLFYQIFIFLNLFWLAQVFNALHIIVGSISFALERFITNL